MAFDFPEQFRQLSRGSNMFHFQFTSPLPCPCCSMGSHRVGHDWCDLAAAAAPAQSLACMSLVGYITCHLDRDPPSPCLVQMKKFYGSAHLWQWEQGGGDKPGQRAPRLQQQGKLWLLLGPRWRRPQQNLVACAHPGALCQWDGGCKHCGNLVPRRKGMSGRGTPWPPLFPPWSLELPKSAHKGTDCAVCKA